MHNGRRFDDRPGSRKPVGAARLLDEDPAVLRTRVTELEHRLELAERRVRRIRENETVSQRIVELAREGIWIIDARGYTTFANARLGDLVGYEPQELVGHHAFTLLDTLGAERFEELMERVGEEGVSQAEIELLHRDGRRRRLLAEAASLRAGAGREGGVFVGLFDVSEQMQRVDHLEEREELFRQLAESSEHVFWFNEVDPPRVLYASPAFESLWGVPLERLYRDANFWMRQIHPQDRPVAHEAWLRCVSGETRYYDASYRVVRPDGSVRHVEDHGVPLFDEQGDVVRMHGVAKDVTERVVAREKERESEELHRDRERLESLGVLTGGIAHDFNNILMTVIGGCQLLGQDETLREEVRARVGTMERSARRAAELCEQMLTYAGQGTPKRRAASLNHLVAECAEILDLSIHENVELSVHISPTPLPVKVDRAQITQVLLNLARNASEALEGKPGRLHVRVGSRWLAASDLANLAFGENVAVGRYATIEVIDDGPGIPAEIRERIFEPFFSTKFRGRGLGLATVLGVVRSHRGGLLVEEAPGGGTTFSVFLPIDIRAAQLEDELPAFSCRVEIEHEPGPEDALERASVLIVDDEADIREIAREALEARGASVAEASHGTEALDLVRLRATPPDVAVVDLTMPGMDGVQLVETLRKTWANMPVVFISGHGREEAETRIAAVEGSRLVLKPFDLRDLSSAAAAALGESRRRQPAVV
jgi:PAS domain S-box-containing protein